MLLIELIKMMIERRIRMDTIPAAEAKTNFGALLEKVQREP